MADSPAFQNLCDIVARLRAPGGCPWDREQTNESLLPALIEEAYEVAEAAHSKDDAHLREELGDLLLVVVMHAEIARETGRFDVDEIIRHVSDKLVRRHPHVFGTSDARDSGAVLKTMGSHQAHREKRRLTLSRQFTQGVARACALAESASKGRACKF